ncbi:MAG: hypothetical protein Q7R62_02920 [bacterium]|nr:hypothetical protein [bacterium]
MEASHYFARILGVSPELIDNLDAVMRGRFYLKHDILENLRHENEKRIGSLLGALHAKERDSKQVLKLLQELILKHEQQLKGLINRTEGISFFDKIVKLSRKIANVGEGYFLKREYAKTILIKRPPTKLLSYLGYSSMEELLSKEDVTEIFSALRFVETDEWMHQTFKEAYSSFTAKDFEQRPIEIKVLGPQWAEVAAKFVAKKHHNVSHLKEFGVIFLNPIAQDTPGKLIRDFALLLHYFHEIEFYSKLFRYYAPHPDFAERLKALLRGDVASGEGLKPGQWLIVQRYLVKESPTDPRLFIPRVNPESLHWMRGERDLTNFGLTRSDLDLEVWQSLDWTAAMARKNSEIISFDLEDSAMMSVSAAEGGHQFFTYHQREALWTKMFSAYVGGETATERLLIENYEKGVITF